MRRLLACAAFGAAAIAVPTAAVLATSPAPVFAASATGALYVTTLPAGAEVYVDGAYVGRSPVLVDALGAGRHGVTMTKAGWVLRETDVAVAPNAVAFEDERLVASSAAGDAGAIVVRGLTDGAVWLDGARVSGRGALPAAAGAHHVTILASGVRTTRDVTVFPDMTTAVLVRDAAPAAQAHAAAAVVASVDEWLPDAAIEVAGKRIVLRYEGHEFDGRLGDPAMRVDGENVSYQGAPEMIAGKLYLPLGVLERLSGTVVRAEPKK